jgi:hypothetical protein
MDHLRKGLEDMKKGTFFTLPGLELRPLGRQPVASRYTDWDLAAHVTSYLWPHLRTRRCFYLEVRQVTEPPPPTPTHRRELREV